METEKQRKKQKEKNERKKNERKSGQTTKTKAKSRILKSLNRNNYLIQRHIQLYYPGLDQKIT